MKTYVLVENNNQTGWFQLLEPNNEMELQQVSDRFIQNIMTSMVKNQKELTLQQITQYGIEHREKIRYFLDRGETVLINPAGGFCFIVPDMKIRKTVKQSYFPTSKEVGSLTGWLRPDGTFLPCLYGEHHIFSSSYDGEDKDLYVAIGKESVYSSSPFTAKQKAWFQNKLPLLDETQRMLIEDNIN